MYNASADFNTKIKLTERMFSYSGSIVTVGGTTYSFAGSDIRSGRINRSISGDSLEIGTVYASELTIDLGLSINRYELYGAEITLDIQLDGALDVIPMGKFTIAEINQTADRLHIKAYDNMIKLDDVKFSAASNINIQSPYQWLVDACTTCGITLGITSAEVEGLPNGNRDTGFADVVTDASTWRDVVGYLGAYLGSFAYIGRDGALYLGKYKGVSDDTVPASFRYTSSLSDYRTTYDGIYGTDKEAGVQEYVANSNSGGIVLDIGVNPFLQFNSQASRLAALGEIIDAWNGIYYVPYEVDMPLVPTYDVGDVLAFTGNQAGAYDVGVITEIVYTIGGQMHVKCAGDNPLLTAAQDRFTKTVAGLSADYANGQEVGGKDFWLLFTTNTSLMTVGNSEVEIAEIEYDQKTYGQNINMLLTVNVDISASATVNIRVVVDDDASLEMDVTEEKTFSGEKVFHCTNPQKIYGEGIHTCKVYMTITDNPITVGGLY